MAFTLSDKDLKWAEETAAREHRAELRRAKKSDQEAVASSPAPRSLTLSEHAVVVHSISRESR